VPYYYPREEFKKPLTVIAQFTSACVLFVPIGVRIVSFVPLIGPSIILFLTAFFASEVTISLQTEFLKAITVSLSTILPTFRMFITDLVPCQYSGSLSISETIFHTLSNGGGISV
jgi:hypothetical protein